MCEAHSFEEVTANCPWRTGNDHKPTCCAQRSYNGHVNDCRDYACGEDNCAVWQMLCNMDLEMK